MDDTQHTHTDLFLFSSTFSCLLVSLLLFLLNASVHYLFIDILFIFVRLFNFTFMLLIGEYVQQLADMAMPISLLISK